MVRAGLLPLSASASTAAYEGFRVISEWPELLEALNTPGVRVLRGAEDLSLGVRRAVPDTTGPESLVPEEKVSSLKLGRKDYEDTNRADKAPAVDALGLLRSNRAAEEEALKRISWYRHPFWRNLIRLAALTLIASPLLYFGYSRMATDLNRGAALFAGGAAIVIGGGYYIYFVSASRWDMD